jgi:hypothetical protein
LIPNSAIRNKNNKITPNGASEFYFKQIENAYFSRNLGQNIKGNSTSHGIGKKL